MPSTYTSNLGIELPADGELDGVWGDVVNDNMSIIDRAVNGSVSLSLSGTSSTLTTTDGTLSDGQYKLLVLAGTPSGTHTITISPNDAQKIYFVRNTTAQSVVFTQGSGGNVTIATGDSGIIYSNGGGAGAAVVNLTDHFAMNSVNITGGSITGITDLAIADGGTGSSTAAGALINFGLTATAAELNYTDGVTSNIQTQLDAKQPLDAELTAIAALAVTDGNFIVGNGTTWVAESGATARTSLGLGSIATQASSSVSITGGSITGITDLAVADGGTGASDAGTARTNLGLAIGTNVQAWDANLDQIAALAPTANNFIVGNGTAWTLETPAQALASLGVTATAAELNYTDGVTSNIQTQLNAKAPLASPTFTGTLNVTGNIVATTSIDAGTQFLGQAADTATAPSFSWTGDTNLGMYRPATDAIGFTTAGSERFRIASAGQLGIGGANYGTAGQVLTSNGSAAAPSWAARAAPTTAEVGSATAGLAAGAVGSYAFLYNDVGTADTAFGGTLAGSNLIPAGFYGSSSPSLRTENTPQSGTWRCMGFSDYSSNLVRPSTVWLRIS